MSLPIGTPLWKKPNSLASGVQSNTLCVTPASTTSEHSEFVGVTVRDGEDEAHELMVQRTGDIFARVMCPVAVGDAVRFSAGNNYLIVGGETPSVGTSLQANSGSGVKLIKVRTASSGGSSAPAGDRMRWG